MASQKLKAFLDSQGVRYVSIQHYPAFTATHVAASAHVPSQNFAKTIIVRIGGMPAMLVLPANRRLLMQDLRDLFATDHVKLISEAELRRLFPDCEVGAMPPFGNLYQMRVYVTAALTEDPEITFNAGSHTEAITMAYADYQRLVQPKVLDLITA